jgi:hypothetical protein
MFGRYLNRIPEFLSHHLLPVFLCLLLLVTVAIMAPRGAAEVVAAEGARAPVEHLLLAGHLGGAATAVAVRGDLAYVGSTHELTILDTRDRAAPRRVGYLMLPGVIQEVALSGDHLFVAAGRGGLHVVDVTDPTSPVLRGSFATVGEARDVVAPTPYATIPGRYAYVLDTGVGLRVVDFAAPARATEVGRYTLDGIIGVEAIDSSPVYVVTSRGSLRILDLTDPATPVEVSVTDLPGVVSDLQLAPGQILYASGSESSSTASGQAFLEIISVFDPARPEVLSRYVDPLWYQRDVRVEVRGRWAFLTATQSSRSVTVPETSLLMVVDVANLYSPTRVGGYYRPAAPVSGMAIAGDSLYLAAGAAGLEVLDVANPAPPARVGLYQPPASVTDIAAAGDFVHLLGDGLYWSVDVTEPAMPVVAGKLPLAGWPAMEVAASHAYVLSAGPGKAELRIADISDPRAPAEVGAYRWTETGEATDVAVAEPYVFVTTVVGGLRVLDVSDPAAPIKIGSYVASTPATSVAVRGDYAFVGHDQRWDPMFTPASVHVLDISDPTEPRLLKVHNMPGHPIEEGYHVWAPRDIVLDGDLAYLATGPTGLRVLDISDPANTHEVGFYRTPDWVAGLAVRGTYVFVADREAGLAILDVSDPAAPREIHRYDTPGQAVNVAVEGNTIYLADSTGGLFVFHLVEFEESVFLPIVHRGRASEEMTSMGSSGIDEGPGRGAAGPEDRGLLADHQSAPPRPYTMAARW